MLAGFGKFDDFLSDDLDDAAGYIRKVKRRARRFECDADYALDRDRSAHRLETP